MGYYCTAFGNSCHQRVKFDKGINGNSCKYLERQKMIKKTINDFIPQQVLAITRLHDVAAANRFCLSIQ